MGTQEQKIYRVPYLILIQNLPNNTDGRQRPLTAPMTDPHCKHVYFNVCFV